MNKIKRRYWGYRIDTNHIDFFRQELGCGVLRQGWGWDIKQDLRNLQLDEGARRNLAIFQNVKKNDILLIPRCPSWDEVGIAVATEDFSTGYNFLIQETLKDYGHCFPAKLIKSFVRDNAYVSGKIRATIKNVSRFWNLDHCGADIEYLLDTQNSKLLDAQTFEKSFDQVVMDSFHKAFDPHKFSDTLYDKATSKFSNEDWEFALVQGLKRIFPEPAIVERTGGPLEAEHGTDILIRLTGLLGFQYLIAIQVKDFSGDVNQDPIQQIRKADSYWNTENSKLVDKYLIITKAHRQDNLNILQSSSDVKIIFAHELKELLTSIGRGYLGFTNR